MTDPSPFRAVDLIKQNVRNESRSIVMPQWGGLELFFGKLTLADMEQVAEEGGKNMSSQERNLRLLINKAKDKDGKLLFSAGDRYTLQNEAEYADVLKVINFMFEVAAPKLTPEEAQSEVRASPTSASA